MIRIGAQHGTGRPILIVEDAELVDIAAGLRHAIELDQLVNGGAKDERRERWSALADQIDRAESTS